MVIGRSKTQIFNAVKERVAKRLGSWKGKLLSQAGKEILLKAVVSAMPLYVMSDFRLPNKLCKEISSLSAKFWWGEIKERKRYIGWVGKDCQK